MDVEDKSVEVDFEWVKNLVSDGKIREHGLATAAERSTSPKFLLLDVRRLVFFNPLNAGIFYVTLIGTERMIFTHCMNGLCRHPFIEGFNNVKKHTPLYRGSFSG